MNNLVSKFSVKGLNGYKNISIDLTENKPSIIIAENGSSKTNFMKMLAYLLEGRYFSLNEFKFDSLNIEFNQNKKKVQIKSKELSKFVDNYRSSLDFAFRRVTSAGISFDDYLIFIKIKYNNENFDKLKEDPIIRKLYVSTPFDFEEIKKLLSRSKEAQNKILDKYRNTKNSKGFNPIIFDLCIKDAIIQYLPTYRRIESSYRDINYYNEDPFSQPLLVNTEYNKMYFGLPDVHQKINSILKEIKERTSSSISKGLLNFIEGKNSRECLEQSELEYVKLSFLRVNDNKDISNVFREDFAGDLDKQLSVLFSNIYDLLTDVRRLEDQLLDFIKSVNLFFSSSGDKKQVELESENLKFRIFFVDDEDKIPINIDDLSSGEKQILSMFASVYLSDKSMVLLIDEPEISLSLKWQRLLLPELIKAPFCKQLIAITHSPFIFDNELNDCAIPMNVSNNLESFK